jgi:hypothetical protein
VQDHGDGGRQTLFDTGADSIGDGLHMAWGTGVVYNVGPYTLRAMGAWQNSDGDRGGTPGKKRAHSFLIGHDLFIWSPKGFLTGSSSTAGSILLGTHFERVDMSVGCNDVPAGCSGGHLGQFHRNRILLREADIWYFIAPRMSVGLGVLWYDAANLRVGPNQACANLGICDGNGNGRDGKGGDWLDVMLNWRYTF